MKPIIEPARLEEHIKALAAPLAKRWEDAGSPVHSTELCLGACEGTASQSPMRETTCEEAAELLVAWINCQPHTVTAAELAALDAFYSEAYSLIHHTGTEQLSVINLSGVVIARSDAADADYDLAESLLSYQARMGGMRHLIDRFQGVNPRF